MEKIKITAEDGEIIELFVIEQTRLEGINYLLVTETEDEEAEAYILKDISSDDDKEAVYEFVDDDNELDTLAKLFSELIQDPLLTYHHQGMKVRSLLRRFHLRT